MNLTAIRDLNVGQVSHFEQVSLTNQELLEEAEQIEAAKADRPKFRVLYEKYFKKIFMFIQHKIGDEQVTADITSDVFFRALNKLDSYRFRNVPFSAWLYRIAINEVYQFFRKNKKTRKVAIDDNMLGALADEVEDNQLALRTLRLEQVLQKLSPKEVQLIELRYYEGNSFRELGEILNITENNAKVKVHRIIKKLKKFWHHRK